MRQPPIGDGPGPTWAQAPDLALRVLHERFGRARDEGDLPADADPAALARYLSAVANGICMQAASGASAAELRGIAQIALASFPAPSKAKPKKKAREAA